MVKRLPTVRETQVQSLGRKVPLEKEMATHSSIPAWKIPWTEKPDRLQSMGVTKSRTRLSDFTSLHFTSLHFTSLHVRILPAIVGIYLAYVSWLPPYFIVFDLFHNSVNFIILLIVQVILIHRNASEMCLVECN